jgi:hypothetical protein
VATLREEITTELERLETDVHYTERAHFSAAEQFKSVHLAIGGIASIAAAAAALTVVQEQNGWAVALAIIASVATAIVTFVKPLALAERHVACGRHLNGLKLRVRQARTLDAHPESGRSESELREMVNEFTQQKEDLHADAPTTGPVAFWRAQRKFSKGHYDYDE